MPNTVTLSADELDDIIVGLAHFARHLGSPRKLEVYQLRERILAAHLEGPYDDHLAAVLTFAGHQVEPARVPGNPLASMCPTCDAPPDAACRKADGTRLGHHHRERREVAR